jgi:excisionase family DNA binding protein
MLGIEMKFLCNGHQISLDDLVDLVAEKVANRIEPQLRDRISDPLSPPADPAQEAKVVSVPEAARLLGLGRTTVWQYIRDKRIETIHIGPRMTRVRMETVNRIVRDGIPGTRREQKNPYKR